MQTRSRLQQITRLLGLLGTAGLLAAATLSAQRRDGSASSSAPAQSALYAVPRDLGPDRYFTGVPWIGERGVTETVAEIIAREVARIAPIIFLRTELQRVHENTDDRDLAFFAAAADQRQMSFVQITHGRHETDGFFLPFKFKKSGFKLRGALDGFHEGVVRRARGRFCPNAGE